MVEKDSEIHAVAQELSSGNQLYVFKPDDVEQKFFLGEAAITAAAVIFVTAVLKGVNEAAEKRGVELGGLITNWLSDKIADLFRKPEDAKAKEDETKKELNKLKKSVAKIEKKTRDSLLDTVEETVVKILEKRGVLPKKAKEIAKKSRAAAVSELSKVGKRGTK